jgi:Arylsulfotransferase (ASST)
MKIRITLFFAALLFISYSCKNDNAKESITEEVEIRQWNPEDTRPLAGVTEKRGLISKTDMATPGYVLFSPSFGTDTYLMNLDGEIVHKWPGEVNTMLSSYLFENGHLFRLERDENFPVFAFGGQAGIIREYDWDGNLIWDYKLANAKELIHHDIEIMPNGNVLAINYEVRTSEESIAAGRDPERVLKGGLWIDKIIEIKPIRPSGGEIVWEWDMWDHLVQDFDSTKANYGVVKDHPRKININIHSIEAESGPLMDEAQIEQMKAMGLMTSNANVDNQSSDITHVNAVAYHSELDQIVFSCPGFSEIYIIDHSISTEDAKGSAGDLLYRWGNPQNYGAGNKENQKLFGQHDVKWIPKGYLGEDHLIVYNNDIHNPDNKLPSVGAALAKAQSPDPHVSVGDFGNYSSVIEWSLPEIVDGIYKVSEEGGFGPSEPYWEYVAPDKFSFYSPFVSGAQRLKNGNTLITEGVRGRLFEVTTDKEILWEYWNPYNNGYTLPDGSPPQPVGPFIYAQFRSTHFPLDFPAFEGKELNPISPQPEPFIFKMPPPPPTKE